MNASHSHIPRYITQDFQNKISLLVKAIDPVRIICYGVRIESKELWSCFLNTPEPVHSTHLDLLIITKEAQKEKQHELLDRINRICEKGSMRITAVIHCMLAIKEALEVGNTFFVEAYTKGEVVYNNGATSEPLAIKELNPSELLEKRKRSWNKWFALGKDFYEAGCECADNQRNDVAVFLLHQAVELTSIALIRVCMGYRPSTHNLKRLLSIIENFTLKAVSLFPRSTPEETELFNVLCKAYSEVRYKEEYTVAPQVVAILSGRVRAFQVLAEDLYRNKVDELTNEAEFSNDVRDAILASSKAEFTSTREIPAFESIGLDTFAEVILIKGERESIFIESTEDTGQIIKTTVEDRRLWITTISNGEGILPSATIYVTYSTLNGLTVNHAHTITCREAIEIPKLGILQNSRRNIQLAVETQLLDVTLTKGGNVAVTGSTSELWVQNHGSGEFEGSNLECDSATVTILGNGSVSVVVVEELFAKINGSGDLFYKGSPKLKSIDHTGEGKLKQL